MAEPLFLYRTQAETIRDLLQRAEMVGDHLGAVQAKLEAGIQNLTDPVRLLLEPPEAAALERALQQILPGQQQGHEPWTTILGRIAVLRGGLPARHWRSR